MTITQSRKSGSLANRALLGVLTVVAGIAMYSCSATGHADASGEIKVPFAPPIKWTTSVTLGEFTIDGGENQADKCVKVTWTGSDGAEISSDTLETDGTGSASGQIPEGAVRWEAKLVDCPKPKPKPKAGGGVFDSFSTQQQRTATLVPTREFLIYGSPLVPSDDAGAMNLTYSFLVDARDWAHAERLIAPIIAGGIGTHVPASVKVLNYTTMEAGIAGGRVVSAQPGSFQSFVFKFNNGSFYADLVSGTNTLNYQTGSWDVVEMVIPRAVFDYGILPGVTYSNAGSATFTTDRHSGTLSAGYAFDFSN